MPGGALGNLSECSPGMIEKVRPKVSDFGVLYSYRAPRLSTRFLRTRHSSCAKPYVNLLRMSEGAAEFCVYSRGRPSRKSANEFPENRPLAPRKTNCPLSTKATKVLF